jgi:hypothetical protein
LIVKSLFVVQEIQQEDAALVVLLQVTIILLQQVVVILRHPQEEVLLLLVDLHLPQVVLEMPLRVVAIDPTLILLLGVLPAVAPDSPPQIKLFKDQMVVPINGWGANGQYIILPQGAQDKLPNVM